MNFIHELINFGDPRHTAFHIPDTGVKITYGQLVQTVELYAAYFYTMGIRQSDNVGLMSKNSPEYVYAYMALAKLGAVIVPINSHFIGREIAYIIQDAGIKHFVTQQLEAIDEPLQKKYGYMQPVMQLVLSEISANCTKIILSAPVKPNITAASPCVIIYTSGTTGNPKGAVLSHNNLIANVRQVFESHRIPLTSTDNTLVVLPMYHCFAWTCTVLGPLYEGASMTVVDTLNLKDMLRAIKDCKVTVLFAVPSIFNLFQTHAAAEDFKYIRMSVSGGATLPESVAQKYTAKFGHQIMEGYGLSEASPVVSVNRPEKVKIGSIGPVVPDITAVIMDESGNILPIGERGELVIKGPNVMLGYYNLPKETSETLREGWLHTGDVAYQDADGYFYIVDRIKDIVVINGENVYPREIEEILYTYPGIAEAAVIGLPDEKRENLVYAALALKEDASLDVKHLRAFLRQSLATFKVPKEFILFESLPKTSTGKISKKDIRTAVENRKAGKN